MKLACSNTRLKIIAASQYRQREIAIPISHGSRPVERFTQ
jgi:hypothetical protein